MPQTPTSSCSKGSRGLSVQPRVLGIFTETTVSPDPSLRQRPSRYAIRAGRNLPDKEFRSSLIRTRPNGTALPLMPFPACRHAEGTISSTGVPDVWRMASEDSDEIVPGFSPVHLFGDLSDLDEPVHHKMAAGRDQLNTSGELLEVLLLRAQHRVLPEERNDRLQQIDASSHDVAVQMLAVIVIPLVLEHLTNTKELAELVQTRRATRALRDHELVRDLPAGLVAVSPPPASLAHEADREASFSV